MRFFKLYYLTIFIFLQISSNFQLAADEKWEAFKQEFQKSIYNTGNETLQNFSCYISTGTYLKFMEENNDTVHTYPLKFIWMKGNKTFYILQPYDNMGDEQKSNEILKQVADVRKQFQDFYNYWQQFGINSPANDIPDSADIIYSSDSIVVSYSLEKNQGNNSIRKIFSKIGSLKKIQEITDNREIITWPEYTIWKEKYVCNGWKTQIFLDHILSEETITRIELDVVGSHQVPVRVVIDSLRLGAISENARSVIIMQEYEFDIPLRELKAPD